MTREELEQTEWGIRLTKTVHPIVYNEAFDLASSANFSIEISHRNDLETWKWAVIANDSDDFWMDSFDTLEHALSFCKKMGWSYGK
jgi:hypothetical protein